MDIKNSCLLSYLCNFFSESIEMRFWPLRIRVCYIMVAGSLINLSLPIISYALSIMLIVVACNCQNDHAVRTP